MLIALKQYNFCNTKACNLYKDNTASKPILPLQKTRCQPDNPVRLIDAFIYKLNLQQLGFQKTVHHSEGRPPYAPGVLLKLYLYGYLNKVRSSSNVELLFFSNVSLQICVWAGGVALITKSIYATSRTGDFAVKRHQSFTQRTDKPCFWDQHCLDISL